MSQINIFQEDFVRMFAKAAYSQTTYEKRRTVQMKDIGAFLIYLDDTCHV